MTALGNRRSTVVLYSDAACLRSHRVRLVLAEKSIDAQIITVDPLNPPEDLQQLNPRNSAPTLVDRDLALYDAQVISDYLDERYPHPPLMPVDPVSRARSRLTLHRITTDWLEVAELVDQGGGARRGSKAPKGIDDFARQLQESLAASADVFAARPFFLSDDFSMLDATLAPLLWRLPHYGIVLPSTAKSVSDYANRLFKRPAFEASLTAQEREMRA